MILICYNSGFGGPSLQEHNGLRFSDSEERGSTGVCFTSKLYFVQTSTSFLFLSYILFSLSLQILQRHSPATWSGLSGRGHCLRSVRRSCEATEQRLEDRLNTDQGKICTGLTLTWTGWTIQTQLVTSIKLKRSRLGLW